MEVNGSLSGCVLSFGECGDGYSGTICCTPGTVPFSSGFVLDVPTCSASVTLGEAPRRVRAYITGVKAERLPGFDSFISEQTNLSMRLDYDDGVGRGVYPGGLVVLGYVDLPARFAVAATKDTNDKMAFGSRAFLRWSEVAQYLGFDDESLRQAIAFGDLRSLRAFVRADKGAFYATLTGDGIASRNGIYLCSRWDSDDPTQLTNGNTLKAWGDSDDFCSWEKQETSGDLTGYPAVYLLRGFFCVDPWCVRTAAAEGHIDGVAVMPPSWWGQDSLLPQSEAGVPEVSFNLLKRDNWLPLPRHLAELWFRAEDIHGQKNSNDQNSQSVKPVTMLEIGDKPLSTREKNNLLRIIRALAEMSKLPSKGYAESIRKQLETLGLTAPSDDTIRKAVDASRTMDS